MNYAPKIGDRVSYQPEKCPYLTREKWRGYEGTITKIHKRYDDIFDEDTGDLIKKGPLAPEKDWVVTLRLDQEPSEWSYDDRLVFCPSVNEVEPV